jgi:S1-C subfamily serine protease
MSATWSGLRASLVFFLLFSLSVSRTPAQAGGVQAEGTQFRMIRSVSGSKGTPQGGRFAMEDPRSVFYVPDDHQVIVYMEWEGPVGKHHIEGFWKNPSGKVSTLTDFNYEAKQGKFGAYFTLALSEGAEIGAWLLEAHVDGELAGSHAFQILNGARPPGTVSTRKMLTPADIYELALKSSVVIERLDRNGQKFGEASGFLMESGWVITAFECIDGASKLRITYSDGSRFETDQVVSWSRRQDWAVIKANPARLPLLKTAAADSWSVGDTASYLEAAAQGNRVIANVSIDGKNTFPLSGARINISAAPTEHAIGSSLLNEYGEALGIIGGALVPGASAINVMDLATTLGPGLGLVMRGGLVVPVSLLPALTAESTSTPLSVLDSKGEFLPPVTASRNVSFGQLARSLSDKGGVPFPIDGSDSFSHRDPKIHVYLLWEGREKIKGLLTMRLFDLDNHLLNKSYSDKPLKLSLGRGEHKTTTWELSPAHLPSGIYRIDVWLDDAVAWRVFWKLSD